MREIIFRAKRISDGSWVEGGIMRTFHPNYDSNADDFWARKPNCYCICANNKDYFVEQQSIGQFTGLCDKNGKRIFEGDVIGDEFCAWEVRYDFDISCICLYFLNIRDHFLSKEIANEVEVLGTIYDEKGKNAISNCTLNKKMKKLAHQYSERGRFWEDGNDRK